MLNTARLGLQKPETTDNRSSLRTAIGTNADVLEAMGSWYGKTIISTAETRTNTAYGLLTTPDQVASVPVATNGLLLVAFSAMWKAGAASQAPDAALFIGANQLKAADMLGDGWNPQSAALNPVDATAVYYRPVFSSRSGLVSPAHSVHTLDVADMPTTGAALSEAFLTNPAGGMLAVEGLAAGTYTVSVQWRNTTGGGSVTAKNRRLRVWSYA